jgi:hypothetical protein
MQLLEAAGKAAAALSLVVLWLAFSYEYGFFQVVGREFQSLFGPTDYFASATSWLPSAAIASAAGMVWHFLMRRMEGFRSKSEMRATYKTRWGAFLGVDFPFKILGAVIVISGGVQLLFDNPYLFGAAAVAVSTIWFWLCSWFFRHDVVRISLSTSTMAFIFFAPPTTLMAYWNGLSDGQKSLTSIQNVYTVQIKGDAQEKKVQLLRNLNRGILFRDPISRRVGLYNWTEIVVTSTRADISFRDNLFCKLSGFDCKSDNPAP